MTASTISGKLPCSLFVFQLPQDCTLDQLKDAFEPFGSLLPSTRLVPGKTIGFVDYASEEAVERALEQVNVVRVNGKRVRFEAAKTVRKTPIEGSSSSIVPEITKPIRGLASSKALPTHTTRSEEIRTARLPVGNVSRNAWSSGKQSDSAIGLTGANGAGESIEATTAAASIPNVVINRENVVVPNHQKSGSNVVDLAATSLGSESTKFRRADTAIEVFPSKPVEVRQIEDQPPMCSSIYVASIPDEMSSDDIMALVEVNVSDDYREGLSFRFLPKVTHFRGLKHGFIDCLDIHQANNVLSALKDAKLRRKHNLKIELAKSAPQPSITKKTRTPKRMSPSDQVTPPPQHLHPQSPQEADKSSDLLNEEPGSSVENIEIVSPSPSPSPSPSRSMIVFGVKIPHVPTGTTHEELYEGYSRFGKITEFEMKIVDLNSGKLVGNPLQVAPDEPLHTHAVVTFDRVEDAKKAANASKSKEAEAMEIVRDGESLDVIIGPCPASKTLAQIARIMAQYGTITAARLVKQITSCTLAFDNERSAKLASENAVALRIGPVTALLALSERSMNEQ